MASNQAYELLRPFPPSKIYWRVGSTSKDKTSGIALAYIDARSVMWRFDEVLGVDGWEDSYSTVGSRTVCTLRCRINGEWVSKSDGAGDTQIEGEKGGLSDAFKRAAVKFGVGRYLYALPTVWVDLDQYKRIKNPPKLPDWAMPNHPHWDNPYGLADQLEDNAEEAPQANDLEEKYQELVSVIATGNKWQVRKFIQDNKADMDELFNFSPAGHKSKFKQDVRDINNDAAESIRTALEYIREHIDDQSRIAECFCEMEDLEYEFVMRALSEVERAKIETFNAEYRQ